MADIHATSQSARTKSILHVECCTAKAELSPDTLAEEVGRWLRTKYVAVLPGQFFDAFPGIRSPEDISFIQVAELTSNTETVPPIYLNEVDVQVDVFQLHAVEGHLACTTSITRGEEGEEVLPQAKIMALPSSNFQGVWDSLIFEEPVQYRLLNFILRMISFSTRQLQHQTASWNRIVLLYGPPGTGKTSLCRALSQKISIRLGKSYPVCKLVEFDAHSLFSKYFSESGKLVSKLFAMIESILDADESTFVCLFIDEIESLASTRQHSVATTEPQDSLRAVNALLIALDRLRHRPNVVVLCTSNMIKAMDPAVLDRVDIKQHIPEPGSKARYEILRACYLELAQCGVIAPIPRHVNTDECAASGVLVDMVHGDSSPALEESHDEAHIIDKQDLPPFAYLPLHRYVDEECLAKRLWLMAEKSKNLSGRILRRLPITSIAMYAMQDMCTIDDAFAALSRAVDEQVLIESD